MNHLITGRDAREQRLVREDYEHKRTQRNTYKQSKTNCDKYYNNILSFYLPITDKIESIIHITSSSLSEVQVDPLAIPQPVA